MNTKTIMKSLALAMLMPAILLTTACSSDDEIINTENPANAKGYALPVTINVTRQSDATRASYDETSRKLNFSAGDKLFVYGFYDEDYLYDFAGELTWQSGDTFSGTLYLEGPFEGTAEELLNSALSASANLLPAGYDSYGFWGIDKEGTCDAWLRNDPTKAFALTKATAVEQFSEEFAEEYNDGFTLSPTRAIVSFTISGLEANKEITVSIGKDTYELVGGSVKTDASGDAIFAIGVMPCPLNVYSLTVDGNVIALPDKSVEAGHIYNISRSVAPAGPTYPVALSAVTADYLGSVVTTDGNVYATVADATAASKTAAAVIAYVSSTGHGLAIALADESSKASAMTLISKIKSNNNIHTPAVSGQTWKLHKEDEWKQMFSANGGNNSSYSGLNTAITNAGGSALQASVYWVDPNTAALMTLSGGNASFGGGGAMSYYYVRVGFAF